jgi:hypothetical protein
MVGAPEFYVPQSDGREVTTVFLLGLGDLSSQEALVSSFLVDSITAA